MQGTLYCYTVSSETDPFHLISPGIPHFQTLSKSFPSKEASSSSFLHHNNNNEKHHCIPPHVVHKVLRDASLYEKLGNVSMGTVSRCGNFSQTKGEVTFSCIFFKSPPKIAFFLGKPKMLLGNSKLTIFFGVQDKDDGGVRAQQKGIFPHISYFF